VSTVFPDEGVINKLQPSNVLSGDFQHLSAGVRTCRSYLEREVDIETMQLLVENMKHYPSASNARPVEITIFNTKETIENLNNQTARKLIDTLQVVTSPFLKPILRLLAPKLNVAPLRSYKKLFITRQTPDSSQVCHHAPAVMLFHAPVARFGMAGADACIWATYTSLFARTLGLGSCFNGFIVNAMKRSRAMRKEFKIPETHQVYAALLLGHPRVSYKNEAGRVSPKAWYI